MPRKDTFYRKLKRYKYQTTEEYSQEVNIQPENPVGNDYIQLAPSGLLIIHKHYSWDGATAFPDRKDIMRGSLVHDALYQLMREGHLEQDQRNNADRLLEKMCREDGMPAPLCKAVYSAVKHFGKGAAKQTDNPQDVIFQAP